jgi:hypothetical protein
MMEDKIWTRLTDQPDWDKMMQKLGDDLKKYDMGDGPHPLLPGAPISQMFKTCRTLKS